MHRTLLKWLHWLCVPLITYFWLVEPEENRADPGGALSTLAGVGMVPISLEIGPKGVYELVFNGLIILIVAHTLFYLWRHFILMDNALRIMVPKALHKYLK